MLFTDKDLILFDFDGTLVDSVPDLAGSINAMLSHLGRDQFSESAIRHWVGNGARDLVARALSGQVHINDAIPETDIQRAMQVFFEHYEQNLCVSTTVYDGVPDTLTGLRQRGYRLALVTNKPERFVPPMLAGLQLDNLFECVLGGDSLPRKKPDPLPLNHCCESLGVPVSRSVMVGDSRNDIEAAHAAGMHSVGVTYGYNYGESIDVFKPDAVIEHFSHMMQLFPSRGD